MTARAVEPAVYDAAIRAVEEVVEGIPAWVITVAVNAAIDEWVRSYG